MSFCNVICSLLTSISSEPALLKRSLPATVDFLWRQGNLDAQGNGNKVTEQEASFADLVIQRGFQFLAKGAPAPSSGLYYLYQVKGSQAGGDFGLREYQDSKPVKEVIIDLKHTLSKIFYLNDGWFENDVIYIISWNSGTAGKPLLKTHIALGQNIPTVEENAFMDSLKKMRSHANAENKRVGSLMPYVRFANKYSCERFTPETAAAHLSAVINSI